MLAPINGSKNKFVSTAVPNLDVRVSAPANTPPPDELLSDTSGPTGIFAWTQLLSQIVRMGTTK